MSAIGLSTKELAVARAKVVRAGLLVIDHRDQIHYSQGPDRWDGILYNRRAYKGQFPTSTDCSGMGTWLLFDALKPFINDGLPDIVNGGKSWRDGGYTGTMIEHGVSVSLSKLQPGDAIIYGPSRGNTEHVAIALGRDRAMSHGSEAAPFLVSPRYRGDIIDCRRYLR